MGWGWDGIGGCRRLGRVECECVGAHSTQQQHVGEGGVWREGGSRSGMRRETALDLDGLGTGTWSAT